jgi:hypothetical protein
MEISNIYQPNILMEISNIYQPKINPRNYQIYLLITIKGRRPFN